MFSQYEGIKKNKLPFILPVVLSLFLKCPMVFTFKQLVYCQIYPFFSTVAWQIQSHFIYIKIKNLKSSNVYFFS